ncbi:flagellar hook-associated protein FlgL [Sodalis sp. dw_96]|uniref:flagellar hook-associated protein FlgL n=1 Tax=Sodalis sp. dw_96 TaxID=2719794 RepID=UPI001BD1E477|nr:flagellar hook-associated protein FlgL [Sodalis sp. dw_96]
MHMSTSMIYQQSLNAIDNNYSLLQSSQMQLSTGNRVNVPSDDPIAASQAVIINQTQSMNTEYSAASTSANNSLSLESSVLGQITTVIQNAQTLIIQAGDGTLSDSDRQSLATTLESYKAQLLSLANTKDSNGNYIFAGYDTGSAPYSEAASTGTISGAVSYSGGNQAITQQVDATTSMAVGDVGSAVFDHLQAGYTPEPDSSDSDADIFGTIDDALTALTTPQDDADSDTTAAYSAAMAKATRGLGNSLNNVLAVQSSAGTKLNQLDAIDSISTDRSTMYQTQIGDLTGTDWYSAISAYSMQQAALQASYTTFSAMSKLSLFQMNS